MITNLNSYILYNTYHSFCVVSMFQWQPFITDSFVLYLRFYHAAFQRGNLEQLLCRDGLIGAFVHHRSNHPTALRKMVLNDVHGDSEDEIYVWRVSVGLLMLLVMMMTTIMMMILMQFHLQTFNKLELGIWKQEIFGLERCFRGRIEYSLFFLHIYLKQFIFSKLTRRKST